MANALIAYYSRAGENFSGGRIKKLPVGNTAVVAEIIRKLTGADQFQIEQAEAYSADYYVCIDQAKQDLQREVRPALKSWPEGGVEPYDVLYLGYPNYWGTMPVAVFSFLERYDFGSKIILPFCTHEDGGMGRSEDDLRLICPTAIIRQGLSIKGGYVQQSGRQIEQWLKNNNINEHRRQA